MASSSIAVVFMAVILFSAAPRALAHHPKKSPPPAYAPSPAYSPKAAPPPSPVSNHPAAAPAPAPACDAPWMGYAPAPAPASAAAVALTPVVLAVGVLAISAAMFA